MKKIISLMLIFALVFSFSACGGNGENDKVEETPPTDFPIQQLGEAYLSGNGAVYDDFVYGIKGKKFNFTAIVEEVESRYEIKCNAKYYDVYKNFYGLRVNEVNLDTNWEQTELLMTLKEGDIIEIVGTFDNVWIIGDYNSTTINFKDVVIKSVNETPV